MKKYEADRSSLNLLRVLILVLTVILILPLTYFLSGFPVILITVSSVLFAAGFFTALVYLPVYFKKLKYFISDEKIIKISGFYFVSKQIVRIDKIQYVTEVSSPFSKKTGLNFILLYAYGGSMAVMFLSDRDYAEISYNLKV